MLKLAILAFLAAAAHAGTYTCSLEIGGVAQPIVTTPTSCQAGSVGFGPFASAGPGNLATGGQSNVNLFGTASMVDSITISGLTGTGTLAYRIQSDCFIAIGSCFGDGPGWRLVPFTYDTPIPITLSLSNADTNAHPPASLGVHISIDSAAVIKPGTDPFQLGGIAYGRGDFSVPGAFLSARFGNFQFVAAPVPEPSLTLAVLALLILMVGWAARRASR